MKFFRIDLLTLLISLFILGSCKNPGDVGLPVGSAQSLQTVLVDTSTITTTTVLDDTVLTANLVYAPLSNFKDPIFGATRADIAATLNLPGSTSYSLPTGTIYVDSAVLVMQYAPGFYGDSLSTSYKVNVFQLAEPVLNQNYYNDKVWSVSSNLLGSLTFFPRPNTAISVTQIVTGAKDTLKLVKPQIRIGINPTFVTTHFLNASGSQLATNSVFQNYIKGLYITLDQTRPGAGGTMYFKMTADSANLDVYYHAIANDGTIDTEMVALPVGNPHAVPIVHNYANAASGLTAQLANPNASYNTIYLQGLAGLRAKINFPYIKNLITSQTAGGDLVFNRAELVVTPVVGTNIPFTPTPRLTMYRLDQALQRQLIPDASANDLHYISVASFGGFFDSLHQSYHFIITGYIEELLRGTLITYGTFIAPADTTGLTAGSPTTSVAPTTAVASRTVAGGNKSSAYQMKLNIIYNKVIK